MLISTFLKKYNKLFYIIIFVNLLFLWGCEKENETEVESPYTITAKIEGRVLGNNGYSSIGNTYVTGASVYLSEVNKDGTIQKISQSDATSDRDSRFRSSIDYSGKNKIIVTATKGSETWKSIINNDVKDGLTYYVQPLNDESTAEADVYLESLKNNYPNVTYTDISIFVDETIANQISKKNVTPKLIASAINDVKNIEASAISNKQFVSVSVDQVKLNNSKSFAQSLLERNLYYSNSQNDYDAAFTSFYESIVTSYINSGIEPDTFYKMLEIADRALLRNISNFDSSTKIDIEKRASQVRAYVLNYAVQTKFNKFEIDPQMYNEIVNAGGKLFFSINQSSTHDEIITKFSDYHDEIFNIINKLVGIKSDVIKNLDASIGYLKSGLISSVESETVIDSLISKYLTFFLDTDSVIQKTVTSEEEDDDDNNQIKLSADILVLLNLQF